MSSFAYSETATKAFTITEARKLSSKIKTDLMRIHRFYDGKPSIKSIEDYEDEVTKLLRDGYLCTVGYGFKKGNEWIAPTISYTAEELLYGVDDDRPGGIKPGCDISGSSFHSYLTYTPKWDKLTSSEKSAYKANLPFQRIGADAPGTSGGYFSSDKTYSAGGRALNRSTFRSF